MSKNILILRDLLPEHIEEIEKTAPDYDIIYNISDAEPAKIEIVLGWNSEVETLINKEYSNVKWVQIPFAGVNTMPFETFKKKGILMTNGSGIHQYSVAESAIGLLLGMTRGIVASARNQVNEDWNTSMEMYELHGKTMLIAGVGKIGVHLGQIAKGFGMKTISINRSGRTVENMDEQYVQKDLDKIIHKADIVVNILPSTDETYHLFNKTLFDKMKDDVMFINVGRGDTVQTEDLLAALDHGKVLFAGLDVFEEEPLPQGDRLWSHPNVILTPHIAGHTENYSKMMLEIFKENLEAYLSGKDLPVNKVDLENGY